MPRIEIAGISIGSGDKPFIVAEAGINHNGEMELAFEMIKAAKRAGVDAVKFQTFKAAEFVGDPDLMFTYRSQGKEVTEPMLDMFRRYEFSKDEWVRIKRKCDEEGIMFLSTPQNRSDLELLMEIGVPAIKVGSDDFTNLPLMKSYSSTNLPMIVSCGMADLGEVYTTLSTIGTLEGYPTILLLCTSQYPTPPEDVNLKKLMTLQAAFPIVPVGFSDHTQGSLASSVAVAMGACFFEKHFTMDRNLPGPDHWFSEDPESLTEWASSIHLSYRLLGRAMVQPTEEELKMRVLARRSVVALQDIPKGETLSLDNTGLRRPGNGLPPSMFDQVLGLKATRPIQRGELIQLGDFA